MNDVIENANDATGKNEGFVPVAHKIVYTH